MYEVEPLNHIDFNATGVAEILQNVAFIMSTSLMSCPLDRAFGWDMRIDEPIHIRKARYVYEITEAITKFEPRAIVTNVNFEQSHVMQGKLRPRVKVSINDESV